MTTVNYNDGNWHGHNGGECPVHPETVVEVVFTNRIDNTMKSERLAVDHDWSSGTHAFRVIKEHKEAREWYAVRCGKMHVGMWDKYVDAYNAACETRSNDSEIIHVREVTP